MDAKEFFSVVVVENYKEAIADPANFRKLWNAALSMNTVAEYLALHRAGYPTLDRFKVDEKAAAVRSEYPDLNAKPSLEILTAFDPKRTLGSFQQRASG